MSSAGTGKLAAALFTSTPGSANRCSAASNAAAIDSASRMSQVTVATRRAERLHCRAAGVEVLVLAARDHDGGTEPRELGRDRLAQAGAAAGDEHAHVRERVRRQCRRTDGRWQGESDRVGHGACLRGFSSRCSGDRATRHASGAHLGHVVAATDERLVDHLVGHRLADLRQRQVSDHLARHLHRHCGRRRDLFGHLPHGRVELGLGHDPADDAVRDRLLGAHDPTREHHVADQTVPAHRVQHRDTARVRDHPVGHLGEAEAGALGRHPYVAQQRPLERSAHHPALARDEHGRIELPELLDATVAASHQLVVRELDLQVADRGDVTAGGERLALAPPDDGAHVGV